MNNNPLVSVVITTYNEEKFISDAVMSAVKQNFEPRDYEIIVVDDGGTDNTDQILKTLEYRNDLDFKYMKKKNGGTASARNFGVKQSKGKFITFLDGDDSYLPNKISSSLDVIEKGENVGIVYSDYIEKTPEKTQARFKQNFSRDLLFHTCIISTNSMVRKTAIERVGGFDETFKYVEDYDLWCRIIMSGYFALRVPEILFTYNSHPNSKTNSVNIEQINPEWNKIRERISNNEWLIQR